MLRQTFLSINANLLNQRYILVFILFNNETTDLSRNLIHAHFNRIKLPPALEAEKEQLVSKTIKLRNALIQIALAFNFVEPVRAAMETSQCLLQAIPIGGSPLLQLPGVDSSIAWELRFREKNQVKTIQDLLRLDEKQRRKALEKLDEETYAQAINISKQIPMLLLFNVHFKGIQFFYCIVLIIVLGDKIVTPGAIVQLVFSTRLATEKDYNTGLNSDSTTEPSDDSDIDEDNVDILIGRKKTHNDGDPVPIPLTHAPFFPLVSSPEKTANDRNINPDGGPPYHSDRHWLYVSKISASIPSPSSSSIIFI